MANCQIAAREGRAFPAICQIGYAFNVASDLGIRLADSRRRPVPSRFMDKHVQCGKTFRRKRTWF